MELLDLLRALVDAEASDLHCKPGSPPTLRVGGELVRYGDRDLTAEDVARVVQALLGTDAQNELIRNGCSVGAHSAPGIGRFRVAAYRQRGTVAVVVHAVHDRVPKLGDLGLPPVAGTLATGERGIVLVASPVGNGASTTVAGLIDHVNTTQCRHVVTVEDPIEVLHSDGTGLISQLEVGSDVPSTADGVRASARLDADVVVVSDVSDRDTAAAVLDAAARGRLVIAAIGAPSVAGAIQSFLELFSVEEREIMRDSFSRSVAGVLAQRLMPTVDGGLVAAVETLVRTAKIEHCLADPDRFSELAGLLEEGQYHGMQTMDQALVTLVRTGRIEADAALAIAADPEDLRIELLR